MKLTFCKTTTPASDYIFTELSHKGNVNGLFRFRRFFTLEKTVCTVFLDYWSIKIRNYQKNNLKNNNITRPLTTYLAMCRVVSINTIEYLKLSIEKINVFFYQIIETKLQFVNCPSLFLYLYIFIAQSQLFSFFLRSLAFKVARRCSSNVKFVFSFIVNIMCFWTSSKRDLFLRLGRLIDLFLNVCNYLYFICIHRNFYKISLIVDKDNF